MASTFEEVAARDLTQGLAEKKYGFRLPMLNGNNYRVWAESWEIYLELEELWEIACK